MQNPNYFAVNSIKGSSETNRTYETENYKFSQNQKISFSHFSTSIGNALCSGNVRNNKMVPKQCGNVFGGFYGNHDQYNYGKWNTHHNNVHQVNYPQIGHGSVHYDKPNNNFGFGMFNNNHNQDKFGFGMFNNNHNVNNHNIHYNNNQKPGCGCSSGAGTETTETQWGQTKRADLYKPIDLKAWFSDGRKAEVSPSVFGEYSFDD